VSSERLAVSRCSPGSSSDYSTYYFVSIVSYLSAHEFLIVITIMKSERNLLFLTLSCYILFREAVIACVSKTRAVSHHLCDDWKNMAAGLIQPHVKRNWPLLWCVEVSSNWCVVPWRKSLHTWRLCIPKLCYNERHFGTKLGITLIRLGIVNLITVRTIMIQTHKTIFLHKILSLHGQFSQFFFIRYCHYMDNFHNFSS
jgi:hypothetical protein